MATKIVKTKAMLEFLRAYPPFDGFVKLNSITNEIGEVAMNTIYGDTVVSEYTNGDADREFTFALVQMAEHSTNYNQTNADSIELTSDFMRWIEEQNRMGNFPNFGGSCEVYQIKNLQNMPNLAGADNTKAKYMAMVQVNYIERR